MNLQALLARPARLLVAGSGFALLAGTASCDTCQNEIEAVAQFLNRPENRACETEADCRIVSTACHTFSRGVCAQDHLNAQAAASEEWQTLSGNLANCESGSCTVCGAAALAHCSEGFCGGP
jgi:hypothetical protein